MEYKGVVNLTLEEMEQLKQAAVLKGETFEALMDRCFQDAVDAEIRSICQQVITNFDICCRGVEVMARAIDIMKCEMTKDDIISWLKRSKNSS